MLKKDHKENIYNFDIPLFCDLDKKQINHKSIPVTYYDHTWYSFTKAEDSSWLQLVAVLPYIHNYDLDSSSDSSSTTSSSTASLNKLSETLQPSFQLQTVHKSPPQPNYPKWQPLPPPKRKLRRRLLHPPDLLNPSQPHSSMPYFTWPYEAEEEEAEEEVAEVVEVVEEVEGHHQLNNPSNL